jgi:hypothetical protein
VGKVAPHGRIKALLSAWVSEIMGFVVIGATDISFLQDPMNTASGISHIKAKLAFLFIMGHPPYFQRFIVLINPIIGTMAIHSHTKRTMALCLLMLCSN